MADLWEHVTNVEMSQNSILQSLPNFPQGDIHFEALPLLPDWFGRHIPIRGNLSIDMQFLVAL